MENGSCVYLRGVDLPILTERYLKNEFVELITPLPVDVSLLNEQPSNIVTVNDKTTKISHEFDPGCGRTFVCVGYKVYDKDGKYAVLDPNQEYWCMYCLRKITQNPMGIPIRREQHEEKIFYHMIDIVCSFECMLAETMERNSNCLYAHSIAYISELFTLCTGKDASELRAASDRRFLKRLNGPMTWEEFHAHTTKYIRKPGNVYFIPVIEYLEQDSRREIPLKSANKMTS